MSRDGRVGAVSQQAGVPYVTALRLLEGDYTLVPRSSECLVVAALMAVGKRMDSSLESRMCRCAKCAPPKPS